MTIYDRLAAWSEQARTEAAPTSLPPEAYTDHNLAELERERVMRRGWINVAHISQLAAPGDYVTFEIVDHPVLAVHGVDGVLRAFSNVCPHRSAIIADGCGNRTVFRCPYHAWTYDLSGKLIGAPHMDKDAVRDIRLKELKFEVWQGLVIVNLDVTAAPLASDLAFLEERIAPLHFERQKVVRSGVMEIACNWKVLVENFCESYHLFCVHVDTLEKSTPSITNEMLPGGPGFNHHMARTNSEPSHRWAERLGLPQERWDEAHLTCIYPATVINLKGNNAIWLSIQPVSPGTLRAHWWYTLMPEDDGSVSEDDIALGENTIKTFMAEDEAVIATVQKGLAAGTGNRAPLHHWESTNVKFGQYLADRLSPVDPVA